MVYALGVDLGTTFTAAAVKRDAGPYLVTLGPTSQFVPSAIFIKDDGEVLVGDAALHRGLDEPDRLAREFKRDLGDRVPKVLGGQQIEVPELMGRLLDWVVTTVTEREGSPPDSIAITHPANWGDYMVGRLRDALAVGLAGHDQQPLLLPEPSAAALHYATLDRVDTGSLLAVYDLGGGTFDVAVLRKSEDGFEFVGDAHGIEDLGGIDFDYLLLEHVRAELGERFDPSDARAVHQLRDQVTRAKIHLSDDPRATVVTSFDDHGHTVSITRAEFEGLIRYALDRTVDAVDGALQSAQVSSTDIDRVVLVGGSSRIPLVSQVLAECLGRPVAIDVDPKASVALGAAHWAARGLSPGPDVRPPEPAPSPPRRWVRAGAAAAAAVGLGVAGVVLWPDPAPPDENDGQADIDDDENGEEDDDRQSEEVAVEVVSATFEPVQEGEFDVQRSWEFEGATARVQVVLAPIDDTATGVHREAIIPVAVDDPNFVVAEPTRVDGNVASFFDIVLEPDEQLTFAYVVAMQGPIGAADVDQVFRDWATDREGALGGLTERDVVAAPDVETSDSSDG